MRLHLMLTPCQVSGRPDIIEPVLIRYIRLVHMVKTFNKPPVPACRVVPDGPIEIPRQEKPHSGGNVLGGSEEKESLGITI